MTSTSPIELSMDMNFLAWDILKIYSGIGSKFNMYNFAKKKRSDGAKPPPPSSCSDAYDISWS